MSAQQRVTRSGSHDIEHMINFFYFDKYFWPHLNQTNKKGLTSPIVWTEIQATIFADSANPRSRADYLALSRKGGSQLSHAHRDQVYNLFEQYSQEKRRSQKFDLVDALQHIHSRLARTFQQSGPTFAPIDFVYCDEVQDLLPGQIALLKYLRASPQCGMVLAGDTAQVCDFCFFETLCEIDEISNHEILYLFESRRFLLECRFVLLS
jgi:superfamily I DNA/RNA helicase